MERTVDVWWADEGFRLYKEYIGENILRGMRENEAMIEAVKDVAERYHRVLIDVVPEKRPEPWR